jgi:hypothetical protein
MIEIHIACDEPACSRHLALRVAILHGEDEVRRVSDLVRSLRRGGWYLHGDAVRCPDHERLAPATYPQGWMRCPACGAPAIDGKVTCGQAACGPSTGRGLR